MSCFLTCSCLLTNELTNNTDRIFLNSNFSSFEKLQKDVFITDTRNYFKNSK